MKNDKARAEERELLEAKSRLDGGQQKSGRAA
jgi:hypothetical protein